MFINPCLSFLLYYLSPEWKHSHWRFGGRPEVEGGRLVVAAGSIEIIPFVKLIWLKPKKSFFLPFLFPFSFLFLGFNDFRGKWIAGIHDDTWTRKVR